MSAHPSVSTRFSLAVKLLRTSRGITQSQLASQMSAKGFRFDQQTVQRIEEGTRLVRFDEAYKLAEVFETTVDGMTGQPFSLPKRGSDEGLTHSVRAVRNPPNEVADHLARLVALAETALASPQQGSAKGARHLSENQQRTFNQLTESLDHAVRPPAERHVSTLRVLGVPVATFARERLRNDTKGEGTKGAARRTPVSWVRFALRGRTR